MAGAKLPTGVIQLLLFSRPYLQILPRSQKLCCTCSLISSRASSFAVRKRGIDCCMRNKYIVAHTGCYSVFQNTWRCFSSSSLWRLAAEKGEQRRDWDINKTE